MAGLLFDAHLHIIDPRFPLVPNQGYLPPAFTADRYLEAAERLGIAGGAVVSGSFQAFDQGYLLDALQQLGPGFVGVTQLPADVCDQEVRRLAEAGVRAVRFNLRRGGSAGLADQERLARRVHDLAGWHSEFYLDSREIPALEQRLSALPQIVIDHLGLSRVGLPALLRLVARGAKVKASGFGRLDFAPAKALRQIAEVDPGALLFGSDLPSTRAPRPFRADDIALLRSSLPPAAVQAALFDNAVRLYRPRGQSASSRT